MRWWILGALVLFGLIFRVATFGDPALHTDEEFYFLVGQKILDGYIPYVDIWDRKPPGLFLIFAGIASISRNVLSYQIVAWLSVSFTAFTISRIVSPWTSWRGQLAAGVAYIASINVAGGFGGQAPVFYNLLMALAGLLVIRALPALKAGVIPPKVYGAMALCGLALTVKQVTIAESLFLGGFALVTAMKSGLQRPALQLAIFGLLGATPFVLLALGYLAMGYWPEFYQAMVLSNLAKEGYDAGATTGRALVMLITNALPLVLGLAGFLILKPSPEKRFLAGWAVAAIIGMMLVPNFYWFYVLPVLVPLSAMMAAMLDRPLTGPICAIVLVVSCAFRSDAFDFALHREARANMEKMAASAIAHNLRGTMLVYDGPVYLYALTGAKPLSRLALPWHLTEKVEMQSSSVDARDELRRILEKRPGVIVLARNTLLPAQKDMEGKRLVKRFVRANCRLVDQRFAYESRQQNLIQVWGDCR